MSTVPDSIKSAFPKEIDLGRDVPDYGATALTAPANKAHAKETKKDYPRLYLQGVTGLPKEGYALIYFKTLSATVGEDSEGEDKSSTDVEIQEICLPPTSKSEEDSDLSDAMAALMKEKSDAGDQGDDDDEDAETAPDDEESE